MDFALEPEQEEFRKTVRAFAEEVVAPRAEAMDRAEEMDPAVLDQMAEMGLFGLPFPERHGGMGADYDAGALRTRARLEGGQWVIDGTKAFITNAGLPHSSMVTVAAVTGERA